MIEMPDSITPASLPAGRPAYLGYADGNWPTATRLALLFPGAHIVALTVTGGTLADGIDCEPGNLNAAAAAAWVKRKLTAVPVALPVVYASMEGEPGYGIPDVLAELASLGIGRERVRLLSAHYTGRPHICSPAACRNADGRPIAFTADGTQWTSTFRGVNGAVIDMSALDDGFFGATATTSWTETIMQQLPVLQQGATGDAVKTVQGLCNARVPGKDLAIDGIFGPATSGTVKAIQYNAKITADGIVSPQTWAALLGI